ncbi:hypothetical protein Tco_0145019 [Tanacetum coccineum]
MGIMIGIGSELIVTGAIELMLSSKCDVDCFPFNRRVLFVDSSVAPNNPEECKSGYLLMHQFIRDFVTDELSKVIYRGQKVLNGFRRGATTMMWTLELLDSKLIWRRLLHFIHALSCNIGARLPLRDDDGMGLTSMATCQEQELLGFDIVTSETRLFASQIEILDFNLISSC